MRKGGRGVIVLASILQIITFFLAWRLFYYLTAKTNQWINQNSLLADLAVNLAVAVLLLIVLANVHSLWGLMPIIGGAIGICSGQMGGKRT